MTMVKSLMPKDRYSLAVGFMVCMTLVVGFAYVDYHSRLKRISETKAAGLASVEGGAVFGGLYRSVAEHSLRRVKSEAMSLDAIDAYIGFADIASTTATTHSTERKIVRKGSLLIIAKDADAASQSLQKLALDLGGYVVSAERSTADPNGIVANIVLRVPASRLDAAWSEIRNAATKVETETMDASDVTKQYIDLEATLRNYRAEEAQYLLIMKQTKTVKDTLEVSEHLSEVRGNIEKAQGEFKYLQHDIEMSQINVQIRAQAVEKVMGIQWRPLFQARVALRDTGQALVDYADTMVAFILYLPVLIVWSATIFVVGLMSFRVIRYVWRRTVGRQQAVPA